MPSWVSVDIVAEVFTALSSGFKLFYALLRGMRRHSEGTVKARWSDHGKKGKSSWIMMIMQDFVYWYIFLYVFVCGLYMYPELATRESRFFLRLEYTSWISFTIACSFFESTLKATIARSQETSSSSIWGNSLPRQVCPQNSVLYLCFWEYLNISDFTPQNPVTFRPMRHPGVLHSWKRRSPRRWCRKCQTSQSSPSVSILPDFRARSGEPSKYHGQQYHGKSMAKIGLPFSGGSNCDLTLPLGGTSVDCTISHFSVWRFKMSCKYGDWTINSGT